MSASTLLAAVLALVAVAALILLALIPDTPHPTNPVTNAPIGGRP